MTGFTVAVRDAEHGLLDDESRWAGVAGVRGPKWARLPLVTLGMLGMQILWSVEMGYASPYLISLGLSKSYMSMVFIAGPLSGLVMQPLVGAFSDRCTSRFGRRRPYLVGGTIVSTLALLLLGYTKGVASIFGLSDEHRARLTIWLAVLAIYFIDFSVNAVMACSRAILVDALPASEQELGNAWAGRMSGVGSIAGFFVGNIKLPAIFPFLGTTQLQVVSALSGLLLIITNGVTVYSVKERILLESPTKTPEETALGVFSTVKDIWSNVLTLPYVILRICIIQFLSWIGWFPVLFYTTLWVSDIYTRTTPRTNESDDERIDAGTRAGNRALLFSSIVAMAAFVLLPLMIHRPASSLVINGHGGAGAIPNGNANGKAGTRRRWWQVEMHVATLWAFSNAVFACAMLSTWFIDSIWGANLIIGTTGFSWAVTLWAPFALLGEQIHASEPSRATQGYSLAHEEDDIPLRDQRSDRPETPLDNNMEYSSSLNGSLSARNSRTNLTDEADDDDPPIYANQDQDSARLLGGDDSESALNGKSGGVGDKAGIILGIHNVFVVLPQFIVTGVTAIVFAIFEPGLSVVDAHHGTAGQTIAIGPTNGTLPVDVAAAALAVAAATDAVEVGSRGFDSIGFVFRLGGVCAGAACVLCWQLSKHLQRR